HRDVRASRFIFGASHGVGDVDTFGHPPRSIFFGKSTTRTSHRRRAGGAALRGRPGTTPKLLRRPTPSVGRSASCTEKGRLPIPGSPLSRCQKYLLVPLPARQAGFFL